jgi:hypothetical protein
MSEGAVATCWVEGLAENSDRANTVVWLDDRRLLVDYMGPVTKTDGGSARQVNALIPVNSQKGEHQVRVECEGVCSEPWKIRLV